jgi:DnaJ-class molecular chaperone
MNPSEHEECPYCWGEGTVKRRYGTVGPGPAKIVKQRECPLCEGTGTALADHDCSRGRA